MTVFLSTVKVLVLTFYIAASLYAQNYQIYFGDLHSHTSFSDGQGPPSEAFLQARKYGADFIAVTDHSSRSDRYLFDSTLTIADQYTTEDFVAIVGFEMTKYWGHINVFNSKWYEWRDIDRDPFYALLMKDSTCIAQWNHPTEKYDEFNGFRNYSPQLDRAINLLEIINVRRHTIFESSYIKALDQGWHIGPTANSDSHYKEWIKEYSSRTAILATELTREKLFEALKKRRVYATENSNLHIYYSINDSILGSILSRPLHCLAKIDIFDPDTSDVLDKIALVQIITNEGNVVASIPCKDHKVHLTYSLDMKYFDSAYYYLKIKNFRGEYAFTAPIWIEEYRECEKSVFPEISKNMAVYDISGRLIHKEFQNLQRYKLPDGVYIIQKSDNRKFIGKKIITLQR